MTKNIFWFLSISIVLTCMFTSREFDSRYGRSINGDGKAYYAYLPALFIYQDPSYSFVDSMEMKYYPEDRSQFKDFKTPQKNGKFVNKTFPGLSILYAPFFFLAMFVAWIGGFPVDGYSLPFQLGIAFSHVVYFFIALRFLLSFFRSLKIQDSISYLLFTGIIFGTNIWYYLIYDHSVGHIHSFFLASVFIWTLSRLIQSKQVQFLGWSGVVLSLLVITRPTNGVMILFLPFIAGLHSVGLKELFSKKYLRIKPLLPFIGIGLSVLAIPFLLWKWQSDLLIVYSYGEEGFDFTNPQLFNFLFSFEKGWLLWTPIMLVLLFFGGIYFIKRSVLLLLYYWLPLGLIIYILSSWWCWTYGAGFGQRPLIEYYPFILIGAALFLQKFQKPVILFLLILPFCAVSMIQSYQIANSILNGGTTTKTQYWNHFLQLKRDAPTVIIDPSLKLIDKSSISSDYNMYQKHFVVKSSELDSISKIIIRAKIGGKHKDPNLSLVVSNQDGTFYKAINIGHFIYSEPRLLEFEVDVPIMENQVFSYYLWNGDTDSEGSVWFLEMKCYR